ncbi:hypothetical protein [Actinomyces ruminis]|nr:hypothetical protein [Actinomyces ruminis]
MNQVHSARIAGAQADAAPTADALVLDVRTPPAGPRRRRPQPCS